MEVSREHIEIVQGASGPKARIKGHRIRVIDVVNWYVKDGMSTEEIVENFPTITRADVHAALAYYWDNQEAIDRKAAEDDAFVEATFRQLASPAQQTVNRLAAERRRHVG